MTKTTTPTRRKCPDCGAPNPRKEEKAGEPQETTEKSAPEVGTAEPAVDDTGKESEAAGGTTLAPGVVNLDDDAGV